MFGRSPRIAAFLLHLTGSVLLALLALAVVFLVWYPSPFARSMGVTHIFLLMLGVDVVSGPLITFVVSTPGKARRKLIFDIVVIISIQLSIFGYGISTVASGRPAWLVFNGDKYDLVRAIDVTPHRTHPVLAEFNHIPWMGPKWAAVHLPDDTAERKKIVSDVLSSGINFSARPDLFRTVDQERSRIHAQARPFGTLRLNNSTAAVDQVQAQWPKASLWLPLIGNTANMVVLLDATGRELAVVDLNPDS